MIVKGECNRLAELSEKTSLRKVNLYCRFFTFHMPILLNGIAGIISSRDLNLTLLCYRLPGILAVNLSPGCRDFNLSLVRYRLPGLYPRRI